MGKPKDDGFAIVEFMIISFTGVDELMDCFAN
jgi:hypothetical protein